MSPRLFYWALTSALAGFLFGFDTVVISGAEKTIQSLWNLSDTMHGLAMGSALWGTVFGSLIGSWPTDHWGRKKTLLAVGVLYFISAIWSAFAPEVYSLMLARFLGGLAIGVSTIVAPLYISEIAPAKHRGFLTGMFQFNIVFGILVAFLSNAILAELLTDPWRWMLGIVAVPSLIYIIMCLGIPESPRWLFRKPETFDQGVQILRQVQPDLSAEEVATFRAEQEAGKQATRESFWTLRLKLPILLAILIAFFNQLSGINAILYFAPRIFELTGLGSQAALLQTIGIGIANFVFTFLGLWLIDRLGRKTLLYLGSFGYIASLGLCSWAFYSENFTIVPYCIFAFIAAHAIGQGAVIWVFISEIFPNQHRATGQALGSFTHWIFAALLTTFFPNMVTNFAPGSIFLFFCGMMVLHLLWVYWMVPETKGVPLEKVQHVLGIQ
jgi:MFS transporter, SP family, arabinose:H+ symporter